jgi:Fe-S-cluster containining protein
MGYFYPIPEPKNHIETDLTQILAFAEKRDAENERFKTYLLGCDSMLLDEEVMLLNDIITPKIDCTSCGNCCKSLMITVSEQEADHLSNKLSISRNAFDNQYLEKGLHGLNIINTIPCHFLSNNKCTVYDDRFEGCREFPALHLPQFQKRLFTHFMHYGRCPIIFNVIEHLKEKHSFEKLID